MKKLKNLKTKDVYYLNKANKIIYADNAATTKLDNDAFEAMKPFMLECYANPSQPYSFSRKAVRAIKEARKIIAECINAEPAEIIFTSGGTESDNWAIKNFTNPDAVRHIITSSIEHHAILNSCKNAGKSSEVKLISVDRNGVVLADELERNLKESMNQIAVSSLANHTMVSIMLANNEIGTIQPIKELAEIAHSYDAMFHTDAVQAIGHIPVDVKELGIDMLSASAHKFNGPKGIGFLYCNNTLDILPFHNGGSQENGMRAGTENVPAIVGMAVALKKNVDEMNQHTAHLNNLSNLFLNELNNANIDFIFNGHKDNRLPGNINISIKDKSGEGLLHILDLKGIYISTGSACDSVNQQVSHVIKAIDVPNDYAQGTIRITFGKDNTEQDAIDVAHAIIKATNI